MTETMLSAVTRFLSPDLVGKMATASGLDRGLAQKAVDAAVPAILGSLSHLASQPGGARQLANAIAEQPSGILGSLSGALGGSAQLADQGNTLLSNLLGGGALSNIASAIAKHVGIGEAPMRTLMGLLSPVIMGVMGRQQRAASLDASGLARTLASQKGEIAAAMPAGLSAMLPGDLHESVEASPTIEGRAYDFPRGAYNTPRATNGSMRMVSEPKAEPAGATWPYWLLPLLALGGLLWYLLPTDHGARQTSEPARTSGTTSATLLTQQRPGTGAPSTYLTKAGDDVIPIGAFSGQDIYNRAGEKVGTVKDILIGPDGRISAAVLSVGRFLGIGEKDVAVPFNAVSVERRGGGWHLSVDTAKEALQSAPAFEQTRNGVRGNAPKMPADVNPAKSENQGVTRP